MQGYTRPYFSDNGNSPLENDRLIIDVIGKTTASARSLSSDVGTGSRELDFSVDFAITLCTSSDDTLTNEH